MADSETLMAQPLVSNTAPPELVPSQDASPSQLDNPDAETGDPDNSEGQLAGLQDDSTRSVGKAGDSNSAAPGGPAVQGGSKKLPSITSKNDNKLPGAFFFLTTTRAKTKETLAMVAYDPLIEPGMKVTDIISTYRLSGLPYHEVFEGQIFKPSPKGVWTSADDAMYTGPFGRCPAENSPPWPYRDERDSTASDGIILTFWNQPKQQGIFTCSPKGKFNRRDAKTPIMPLYASPKTDNIIVPNTLAYQVYTSATLDWYAMSGDATLVA